MEKLILYIFKNNNSIFIINMEGLANLGATCAINSLIQILYRINKFKYIILNSNTPENTLTYELKDLFNVIISNPNKSITPKKFITNFFNIFKNIFTKFEENDICELYLFIIQKIHEENTYNISFNNNIDTNNYIYKIANINNFKYSPIYDLFQGIYMHSINCLNCNYINTTYEPFIYLNLNIVPNQSINDLFINQYLSNNEYRKKDDWKCDKCNSNCEYVKNTSIIKFPEIIIIILNRFTDTTNKNNQPININKHLSIIKNYNLQSIAFHHGILDAGHYNAISKSNDDLYYLYDDLNVHNISNIDNVLINNTNSYLLCYL